jgi:hypothetical protein
MSFSLVHEYVFAHYDSEHCSVSEYISELETPSDHGDICDIHYEYHHPYLLPQYDMLTLIDSTSSLQIQKQKSYISQVSLKFLKPPIA